MLTKGLPAGRQGFGIVEIIVAMSLFIIIAVVGVTTITGSFSTNRLGEEETTANLFAQAGIDSVRSIKNQGWTTPFVATTCSSGCGIGLSGVNWAWSGASNTLGKYSRVVTVSNVNRDGSGNIVSSGGTIDTDTKKITSVVTWLFSPLRENSVTLTTYLTNFRKTVLAATGFLIYGDTSTTPKYRSFDSGTNSFSAEASTLLGASGQTFIIRTSPTKTEAISGYVTNAGVLQVMCFNGTSWVNEWTTTVGGTGNTRRFDISYESSSGDVLVLYSNNVGSANELSYRTKSGGTLCGSANWGAATNLDPARTSGTIQWVKMAWDKRSNSDLVTAIWADSASSLSASVWNGSVWSNEPVSALSTTLQVVSSAQDVEDFDVEYESTSGDVVIVWGEAVGNNANGVRYATCVGGLATCTWNLSLLPSTFTDDATNLDISANPNTDEIVFASIGINQNDLQIGYWSGSTWTNTANADTSCNTPIAGSNRVSTGWLISGATTRSIIRYADQGSSAIDWYTGNSGTFTKETDFTQSPASNGPTYIDTQMNPLSKDQLLSFVSDSANDLFAKRLIMSSLGAFTWTNSDGTVLELTLPQAINSPFSFAFRRI